MTSSSKGNQIITETPECDRWSKVHKNAVTIEEFMDFLSEKGIILCMINEYGYFPVLRSRQQLIYDCYNIDADILEKERRMLLEIVRSHSR